MRHLSTIAEPDNVDILQTEPALVDEVLEEVSGHTSNVKHPHVRPL